MFWNEVLGLDERRQADPLRALAAHLGEADDVADTRRGPFQHHRVAADAGADERPSGARVERLWGQPEQKYGVRAVAERVGAW